MMAYGHLSEGQDVEARRLIGGFKDQGFVERPEPDGTDVLEQHVDVLLAVRRRAGMQQQL
ncbi:hypothetical protein E1264_32720 [Actinomadura sp. KC216]|uniref:hypothetical protein n=1 Tax=Actinomadura sp. KC216 TaxID=2530370 RepID=UPI0010473BF9|nr:hypothetical protein [Actinomadura sp. KC216]TDB81431.1 hypothetical protein E1264_32720 [Actinomadura sp. KC216]